MTSEFEFEVFISYVTEDNDAATSIYNTLTECGIKCFFSRKTMTTGEIFGPQILYGLTNSRHFLLYWSDNAKAKESPWVTNELNEFHHIHVEDTKNRRIFPLFKSEQDKQTAPAAVKKIQFPLTLSHVVAEIKNLATARQSVKVGELEKELEDSKANLTTERDKVRQAREHYKHDRFWQPFLRNQDVHIFTCARDVPHESIVHRGHGGRTNIDMWDYRSVLDITHFFLSKYPGVKVTIEDPISKMSAGALARGGAGFQGLLSQTHRLIGKDCIIIGSPDVSDLAEVVLAEIHGIEPYSVDRVKTHGYVIIKEKQQSRSSFYWELRNEEKEGVALIHDDEKHEYFVHQRPGPADNGKMHGILVVGQNPFPVGRNANGSNRIVILSGFSGIATNAISKILTDESYLSAFFDLDDKYVDTDRPIEALIGVRYTEEVAEAAQTRRDTRRIAGPDAITFEGLVNI